VAVLASALGLAISAAGKPTPYVPSRSGGWPDWLSGPLHGFGATISSSNFQALTLVMCAGYALVLIGAERLSGRTIAAAIFAANLALVLGPPLLSQDVFGYLSFARLGALHGLDPYTSVPAQAPTDAVFPFIGWPFQHSPYGPLFTLGSYPLAQLGLAGGLWALKAVSAIASLGATALSARAARDMGRSPKFAAVFVGLNPVLLELAVGGAHNDTLLLLTLTAALAFAAGSNARLRAATFALAAGVAVKVSAGLVLPFVVLAPAHWRERARVAGTACAALVLLAVVAIVGFGTHAFGFLNALGEQQQLIATHSVPAETARLAGLHGVPSWWRHCYALAFVLVLALTLWRTARGAEWRAMAGWATLALLVSTAWLLPWYAVWALPLAVLSDSRRLRIATLVFCAYAVMIHLPLADPLLSPARHVVHRRVSHSPRPARSPAVGRFPGAARLGALGSAQRHGVVFAGLEVVGDPALDLGSRGFRAQAPQA
jgi:hypothetical protein